MTKKRWVETIEIDHKDFDLTTWPIVNTEKLNSSDRDVFLKRKDAVELYMKHQDTIENISERTGIGRKHILRMLKRCLSYDEYGRIWGFRALIPRKRIKEYEKKCLPEMSDHQLTTNFVGAFSLLFKEYPTIQEKIDALYLGRNKNDIESPRIRVKDLHKKFLRFCKDEGIGLEQYPFICDDLARRSLYRYAEGLDKKYFSEAAKRHGEDSARRANNTGIGAQNSPMIIRPLERVQFDAHRIDCMIAIVFYTPEGDEIVRILNRIWLLSIIDVATRVLLGYHISYNKEYSASDVLLPLDHNVPMLAGLPVRELPNIMTVSQ